MRIETLRELDRSKYTKLTNFIYALMIDSKLERVVPLSHIDVNDWENNLFPSVYVHNKNNMFKMKKYRRTSPFDLVNAIKFYNEVI